MDDFLEIQPLWPGCIKYSLPCLGMQPFLTALLQKTVNGLLGEGSFGADHFTRGGFEKSSSLKSLK